MLTFLLTTLRLLLAFFRGFRDKEFQALFFLTFILLVTGTVFYSSIERWSPIDSLYFCVVTLTTIGYGDLTPGTTLGKLFTIMYIFSGIGILMGFITKVAEHARPKAR